MVVRTAGPVIAVVFLAFAARIVGAEYGLPNSYYPDESRAYEAVVPIVVRGDFHPVHFAYPPFGITVLAAFTKLTLLAAPLLGNSTPLGPITIENPGLVYGVGRLANVIIGALSVVPLYAIVRRVATGAGYKHAEWLAFAGAGFLALSPIHVQHSKVASADVPMVALVMVAAYCAVRIVDDGRLRWYLGAGVATALAAGVKYPGAMFAMAIVVAHLARAPWRPFKLVAILRAVLLDRRIWLAGAATATAFVLSSPYALIELPRLREALAYESALQLSLGKEGDIGLTGPLAWILFGPLVVSWGLDLPVAILALVGLAWSLVYLGRACITSSGRGVTAGALAALLVLPLTLWFFSLQWQIRYARYILAAVPFGCVSAALGLAWLQSRVGARLAGPLTIAIIAGAMLWQADGVVRYDWMLSRPDTRTLTTQWMIANLPAQETVMTEYYGPPYPRIRQMGFDLSDRPFDRYRGRDEKYLVTSSFTYDRWLRNPERYTRRAEFYREIDRRSELIFAIEPSPVFAYDPVQEGWNGWHGIPLDDSVRPGPVLRVYRLPQ